MKRFKFTDKDIRDYQLPDGTINRIEIWDEEIKHLCCRLSKTGKKVFQVIGKLNGRTVRVSLGGFPALSVVEARKRARKALVNMQDGINTNQLNKEKRDKAKENLNTVKAVYESMLTVKHRANNTLIGYKSSMKHLEKWHNLPITDLTRQMVLNRYSAVKKNSGPYAANRMIDLLSAICNYSRIVTGKPESNPATVIRDTHARHKEEPRDVSLSSEEITVFLSAIDSLSRDNSRDIILTLFLTGMRKTEPMGLQWQDIDFTGKTLFVGTTKNRKSLLLPMSAPLFDLYKARWELWQRPESGFVFQSYGTTGHTVSITPAINHIKKEIPHFSPHVLRATFTTVAADIGIDGMVIDRLTNHAAAGVTARHYYKPTVDSLREPMERIAVALMKCKRPLVMTQDSLQDVGQD